MFHIIITSGKLIECAHFIHNDRFAFLASEILNRQAPLQIHLLQLNPLPEMISIL